MPFTFSHPAIVLPLAALPRKWISVTGLVIGTLAPDFEKFLKMAPGNTISHTWQGIFWFNLPLGLILALLFHSVVRDPLIHNLPLPIKDRLLPFSGFKWISYFKKKYLTVIVSILIGATSHIAWDSFTHKNGLGVRLFPFLMKKTPFLHGMMPLYQLLDMLGSVLGMLFIFGLVLSLPKTLKRKSVPRAQKWSMYWPVVLTTGFLVVLARATFFTLGKEIVWSLLIASISATLVGITFSSFIVKFNSK